MAEIDAARSADGQNTSAMAGEASSVRVRSRVFQLLAENDLSDSSTGIVLCPYDGAGVCDPNLPSQTVQVSIRTRYQGGGISIFQGLPIRHDASSRYFVLNRGEGT